MSPVGVAPGTRRAPREGHGSRDARRARHPARRAAPPPVRTPGAGLRRAVGGLTALVGGALAQMQPTRTARREVLPEKVTRSRTSRRVRVAGVALALAGVLVVYKLTEVQVLNPTSYAAFGASQRTRTETLAAERGTITDRNGIPLAMSVPTRSVFVDPKLVADPRGEAQRLAAALGIDAADIERKMTAPNRFSYVARQLPDEVADRVAALKASTDAAGRPVDLLPGVAFVEEPKRVMPGGDSARSLLGSVDIDGNGLGGLEKLYGDRLTGTPGRLTVEQSPNGRTIAASETQLIPAQRGEDVQLTIDRAMQYETERILSDQVRDAGAKGGVAVVTRPESGEILAMANVVTDPTTGEVSIDGNNAAVTTVYEPGSVMKMITAAGALEEGKVQPDTVLQLPVQYPVCDATFSDAEDRGPVAWPVSEIIAQSSNVGTIKIGQALGREKIVEYMRAFGIGSRTPLGFPNEQAGSLMPPERWWCSSMGTIPIGQGVSVTPLQMAVAYSAIANGGVYVAPRLVGAVVGADGVARAEPVDRGRRVVSQATADRMNLMLRNVVLEGTGTRAAVDGYTVAGKTGTARKAQPGGGYTGADGVTRYQATFVGFAPAEAPAVSVLVMIDEPSRQGIFGGVVAAPAFAKITESALRRLAVPPPASDGPGSRATIPSFRGARPVAPGGTDNGSTVTHLADGRVRAPAAGAGPEAAAGAAPAGSPASTSPTSTSPASTGVPAPSVRTTTSPARPSPSPAAPPPATTPTTVAVTSVPRPTTTVKR